MFVVHHWLIQGLDSTETSTMQVLHTHFCTLRSWEGLHGKSLHEAASS